METKELIELIAELEYRIEKLKEIGATETAKAMQETLEYLRGQRAA